MTTAAPLEVRSLTKRFALGNTVRRSHVYAVDDTRSEGDRVVVAQHSVISEDDSFDAARVRNVEVSSFGDPYIPLRKIWLERRP